MDWYTENLLHAFTKFRAIAEYWIAAQKIPADIQFNTTVMLLGRKNIHYSSL